MTRLIAIATRINGVWTGWPLALVPRQVRRRFGCDGWVDEGGVCETCGAKAV